jgi:hypothetical protein
MGAIENLDFSKGHQSGVLNFSRCTCVLHIKIHTIRSLLHATLANEVTDSDPIPRLHYSVRSERAKLFETMQALDTRLFEAANHCDYEKLTAMVDETLEFYHDQGGLMLGRQVFLGSIKNNTCGMMIREFVPRTLQVYPIKGYGAIELGGHRFHHPGHEKEFPPPSRLAGSYCLGVG